MRPDILCYHVKPPVPEMHYSVLSHWQKVPQQAIGTAVGYPPQSNSKILLLNTPHTYVIKHGETVLVLN